MSPNRWNDDFETDIIGNTYSEWVVGRYVGSSEGIISKNVKFGIESDDDTILEKKLVRCGDWYVGGEETGGPRALRAIEDLRALGRRGSS